MAIIKIRNAAIDLDAAEIPNIDASKITTGSLGADRIPSLAASKIGSGTFADARIAASNVSQHATSFDDNKIVNDISTIALRQASNENKGAYNTNSMYVDVFQDDTGIASHTTSARNASEYVSSVVGGITDTANFTINTSNYSTYFDVTNNAKNSFRKDTSGASDFYNRSLSNTTQLNESYSDISSSSTISDSVELNLVEAIFIDNSSDTRYTINQNDTSGNSSARLNHSNLGLKDQYTFMPTAFTFRWRNGAGSHGDTQLHGSTASGGYEGTYLATMRSGSITNGDTYSGSFSNSTFYDTLSVRTYHTGNQSMMYDKFGLTGTLREDTLVTNATGNFISNVITAPSSTSKMGAIITYQDQAGTNALNTDIILQLSADNGSNFTTATMTALPDFATGIKMAKVNDLSVTAGTQLKYKISFANQSGSKEARIRGVSLQY